MDFIVSAQYFTLHHLFIQDISQHINKFETYMGFYRLESIYIINYYGNTYVKILPQLRYSDSILTLTCTILAVNEIK